MLRGVGRLLAALLLSLGGIASPVAAQSAPFCAPGQAPQFVFGFAALRQIIGPAMGEAIECEHPNSANGDTLQRTTTGLAFYRKSTNTPTFTDGWRHWALLRAGVVAWSGSDIDPPGVALPPAPACQELGGGACFQAESLLAETVRLLNTTSTGQALLRNAALAGVNARFAGTPPGVLANFDPYTGQVIVSSRLSSFPDIDRAPVLAHELQHATDWVLYGARLDTVTGCFSTEANAYSTEAKVWTELQGGQLKPPRNPLEEELNAIAQAIRTDQPGFLRRLSSVYHEQCAEG
jgi:hypothetical protein